MATYIKKLEGYADLEVSIIRNTKINKVLKALIKLNTIPRDEEYQFRKRSLELLSQWNKILGAEPDLEPAEKEGKATPTTNGIHDEKSDGVPEEKKEDAPPPTEVPAAAAEEKPSSETIAEKPAAPSEAQPESEQPAAAEPKLTPTEEPPKAEVTVPEVVERAPESAVTASEVSDVVKSTE